MLNIAQKAARAAGTLMLRAMDRLEYLEITEKSENDFVTEADIQAEKEIIFHLNRAYPEHSFMAEESGEILGKDITHKWIIDPIDGTANYMRGIPHFCVSIALEVKGRIELGVIFDPVRDEMFTAMKGRGAQLNNRRMRVSNTIKIERALLSTGLPRRQSSQHEKLLEKYLTGFNTLSKHAGDIRRLGSSALDLAYVAAGRLDGYWEYSLAPWDMAAGALMVKEAGGFVTDIEGKDNFIKNGTILAATPKVYPHIFNAL
jgi:myo-inositol-1(or 4)-monophosphatase